MKEMRPGDVPRAPSRIRQWGCPELRVVVAVNKSVAGDVEASHTLFGQGRIHLADRTVVPYVPYGLSRHSDMSPATGLFTPNDYNLAHY